VAFAIAAGVSSGIVALISLATGNDPLPIILIVLAIEGGLALLCFCAVPVYKVIEYVDQRRLSQTTHAVDRAMPVLPVSKTFRIITLSKGGTSSSSVLGTALSGKTLFCLADMPTEVQTWVLRDAVAKALKGSPEDFKFYEDGSRLTDMETIKDVAAITVQQTMRVTSNGQGAAKAPKTLLAEPVGKEGLAIITIEAAPDSQQMEPASCMADRSVEDVV